MRAGRRPRVLRGASAGAPHRVGAHLAVVGAVASRRSHSKQRVTYRSGFVSIVGRPNVGKSTLLNQLVGQKVSIVSDRPQTTRNQVRGGRTTPETQIVFVATPGIHKPRTLMGERANERALTTLRE